MCHEYWHEQKQPEAAEESARREAERLIQKAKDASSQAPAEPRPETEKLPA